MTPQQGQGYFKPFPSSPATLATWVQQWIDDAQAETGVLPANLFPYGVEIGNELEFLTYWPGNGADQLTYVETIASVLHANNVKTITPGWNGTTLAAHQAFTARFLPYCDAVSEHPYDPAPGAFLSAVIAWVAPRPVYVLEGGTHQVPSGPAVAAPGRTQAELQYRAAVAGQPWAGLWIDYPSVYATAATAREGPAGLVFGQTGGHNDPYYAAFVSIRN
jgi:hypothetical protein